MSPGKRYLLYCLNLCVLCHSKNSTLAWEIKHGLGIKIENSLTLSEKSYIISKTNQGMENTPNAFPTTLSAKNYIKNLSSKLSLKILRTHFVLHLVKILYMCTC